MLDPELTADWEALRAAVAPLGSAAVAFSGGADSALVLRACIEFLPAGRAVAVTGRSESLKPDELERARALAADLGVPHEVVDTREMDDPAYRANGVDRCGRCKTELYARVGERARALGLAAIVDGLNADDRLEERPGARAAAAAGVRSPLREAGLGKARVRALSRALALPTWDKPAEPCLSSRIPFGTEVTPERLAQVRLAEEALARLGFPVHRVRHHGAAARVEVPAEDLARALEPATRRALVEGVKAAGFAFVSLDLEGFRSGSAHEALRPSASSRSPSP
ncbi:MAG TPA: ATP-dependent sacrificial sulfur transferase LarE [Planctomycetota bacterium]|nr:ATP-dependent sacrificial sulfur transferase LarE [Planctomycetota bacterium]